MFGDTTIYAPTTGIVSSRSVNVGQVVTQNQALMEIIDPNKLEFAANVPSEAQTQLQIGQQVPLLLVIKPISTSDKLAAFRPKSMPPLASWRFISRLNLLSVIVDFAQACMPQANLIMGLHKLGCWCRCQR